MADRESVAPGERPLGAGARERVRPELARDIGEHARAVALAVHQARAVGEAGHPVQHGVEHLARRTRVLARDGDQSAGIVLARHVSSQLTKEPPAFREAFVALLGSGRD